MEASRGGDRVAVIVHEDGKVGAVTAAAMSSAAPRAGR
jgi:hypothetical protein